MHVCALRTDGNFIDSLVSVAKRSKSRVEGLVNLIIVVLIFVGRGRGGGRRGGEGGGGGGHGVGSHGPLDKIQYSLSLVVYVPEHVGVVSGSRGIYEGRCRCATPHNGVLFR